MRLSLSVQSSRPVEENSLTGSKEQAQANKAVGEKVITPLMHRKMSQEA
jgi:hypothetical protein